MHFSTLSTLLFAASGSITSASPIASEADAVAATKPFKVHFTVGGSKDTFFSANVVQDKTSKAWYIAGERLSVYPGTPAHFAQPPTTNERSVDSSDSTSSSLALVFTSGGKSYGAIVPDIGDVEGVADVVAPRAGKTQYEWSVNSQTGDIEHTLYAPDNLFLACTASVNGEQTYVLKFGEADQSGKFPKGCEPTRIVKVAA